MCASVVPQEGYDGPAEKVSFHAYYSQNEEDNKYAVATPVGNMDFIVTNPEIVGKFKSGTQYYIDITEAE